MHANQMLRAADAGINRAVHAVADFVKLEVVLALLCGSIPWILLLADGWPPLPSISEYYAMSAGKYFYVPLTTASMLFIVNGVVTKDKHWYNLWLGVALAGLTFFDHADYTTVHFAFAAAFFLGNAVVFVLFSPRQERWFKVLLAAVMLVALGGYFLWDWYSLFWAESFSLWVIAVHFMLEAMGWIK